ncbi:MAG: glycosyltransferase family 2 protein [Opitutales bacterium]
MAPKNHISFVIPLYNEEATLEILFTRIEEVMSQEGLENYEVIFVDDGSEDKSWNTIEALRSAHPNRIRGHHFRANRGKAAALAAGFEEANGDIVITLDADLQDDPKEIPAFLAKLEEGYDCVSGWKQLRKDPLGKTLPSRVFNWATRAASGVQLHDFNCGFKAYTKEAVKSLNLYGELHRYIPVILNSEGFKISEISVTHHRRTYGVSKYGWSRLIKGGLDLITVIMLTRYLRRPGHLFGGLGTLFSISGFLILAALSFQKLVFGISIGNRPLFFFGILLLLFGFQLVSVGILGELINYHGRQVLTENKSMNRN